MAIVIALTDFSPLAENAAAFAAELAKRVGADLHLVHIYEWVNINTDPTPGVLPAYLPNDMMKDQSEEKLSLVQKTIAEKFPGLNVKADLRIATNKTRGIDEATDGKEVFAIVTGAHEPEGLDALAGTTPVNVLKHSTHIVIAVPASFSKYSFNRAVIATDLKPLSDPTKNSLTRFLQQLNCHVELVYVRTETSRHDITAAEVLRSLSVLQPSYKVIEGDDVSEALNSYIAQTGTDLLVTLPHHHNLWQTLFGKKHTKSIIGGTHIPVVAIPEQ